MTNNKKASMDDMVEENVKAIAAEDEASVSTSALATYSDTPPLDGTDLFIPRLRLAQGLTQEVQDGTAKPGQWLILGMDPMDKVTIVVTGMTRRREYRDVDTRAVVCRSGDGVTGFGNPGGNCSDCALSHWIQSGQGAEGGKNSPPPCTFIYSYMVWVEGPKTMAILEFSRTAINTGKMLNTLIAQQGVGKFAVQLGAASKQSAKGTFYNPVINPVQLDAEELAIALESAKTIQ